MGSMGVLDKPRARAGFGVRAGRVVLAAFCACTVGMLVTGCQSAPRPPVDRRVTIAEDLGLDLHVTDVRCTKGTSEFLSFQANVVNNTHRDLGVAWKIQWLDADGLAIDSVVSAWREVVIAPNDIKALQCTAPSKMAADMRFYVRRRR